MQYIVKKIINKISFLKTILCKIFDSSKKEKHNDELPYVLFKTNDLLFNLHRGSFISDRL